MVLRALVLLAPLWPYTLLIGRRPLRHAVAVVVGVVVLSSFGASAALGIPVPTVGPGWDGPGLGSADLTFFFGTPTPDLTIEAQRKTLATALRVWSSVARVRFSETPFANQPRSIDINFCPFSTCFPGSPFLAFAFFPSPPNSESVAGDMFINDDFQWEIGNSLGFAAFDLTYIGVHESGHSLGLFHSDNPNSVMFPFVGSQQVFTGFDQDDIDGILSLYGVVPEPTTLLLWGTTAAGLGLARWRQQRRKQQR